LPKEYIQDETHTVFTFDKEEGITTVIAINVSLPPIVCRSNEPGKWVPITLQHLTNPPQHVNKYQIHGNGD
jgi:hypothetical protein